MKPILCITFDDSNLSDFKAYEEMRKRGMNGTSYVIANDLAFKNNFAINHIENIRKMRSFGWDIQDHITGNYALNEMTLAQQQAEFLASYTFFNEKGIYVEHVAYPMGEYNNDTITAVSAVRKTGRTTDVGLNDYSTIKNNWFTLKNIGGDMDTKSKYDNVINFVEQTILENKIMIINFHNLSSTLLIRFGFFVAFLDYIKTKNIQVMTISQMYNYVESL